MESAKTQQIEHANVTYVTSASDDGDRYRSETSDSGSALARLFDRDFIVSLKKN
jgi:hypothetical protein